MIISQSGGICISRKPTGCVASSILCGVAGRHQLIPLLGLLSVFDLSKNPLGNRDEIQGYARKSFEMGNMTKHFKLLKGHLEGA